MLPFLLTLFKGTVANKIFFFINSLVEYFASHKLCYWTFICFWCFCVYKLTRGKHIVFTYYYWLLRVIVLKTHLLTMRAVRALDATILVAEAAVVPLKADPSEICIPLTLTAIAVPLSLSSTDPGFTSSMMSPKWMRPSRDTLRSTCHIYRKMIATWIITVLKNCIFVHELSCIYSWIIVILVMHNNNFVMNFFVFVKTCISYLIFVQSWVCLYYAYN